MSKKQLAGLNKASAQKRDKALKRTELAITTLVNKQQSITIRAVAREAKVSVSYIYKYPELAYKIQRLREQQKYDLVANNSLAKKADQQVELLKTENVALKRQIAELRAIIDQEKTGINKLDDLQIENLQLAAENLELKKELDFIRQSLQTARTFILEQKKMNQE